METCTSDAEIWASVIVVIALFVTLLLCGVFLQRCHERNLRLRKELDLPIEEITDA